MNDLYNVVPGQTMTVAGNTASPDNGVLANDTDVDINQTVNFNGATDGTFELTYTPAGGSTVTTSPITYSTTLSTLQSNVAAGVAAVINGGTSPSNLLITGTTNTLTIAFQNSLAGTPMGTLASTKYTNNNLNNYSANPSVTEGGDYPGSLIATLLSGPAHASGSGGSFTFDANGDGGFTYTPNTGFSGTDTFTYVATDTSGRVSNTATVTITVGTTVSIPQTGLTVTGTAGNTVVVPVDIDNPDPAGSTGLANVGLAINFDPSVFYVAQDVTDPNPADGSGPSIYNGPDSPNYDGGNADAAVNLTVTIGTDGSGNETGQIGISLNGAAVTNSTQGNSNGFSSLHNALVDITFTVLPGAPSGNTVINLAYSTTPPTGGVPGNTTTTNLSDLYSDAMPLYPVPVDNTPSPSNTTPGADDGLIMVLGPPAFTGVSAATSPATVGTSYAFQYTATGYPAPTFYRALGDAAERPDAQLGRPDLRHADDGGDVQRASSTPATASAATPPRASPSSSTRRRRSPAPRRRRRRRRWARPIRSSTRPRVRRPRRSAWSRATLPSGLTLSSTGLISGTTAPPTRGRRSPAPSTPATASAATPPRASASWSTRRRRSPAPRRPPSPATVGTAYAFQYTATGTPAPSFSLGSGTLPSGLTLSSARPALAARRRRGRGRSAGVIDAANGVGSAATESFTIVVDQTPAFTGTRRRRRRRPWARPMRSSTRPRATPSPSFTLGLRVRCRAA